MRARAVAVAGLALGACAWPFVFENRYVTHMAVLICISATLSVSLNMMLRIGQLSAAHAAFMGIGAYASALLAMRLRLPFAVTFLLAGLVVGVVAAVLGPVLLRIKGVYFVLLTFALGQVVVLIFQEWVSLFGGNNGIFGIPKASLFGLTLASPRAYYLFGLCLAAGTLLVAAGMFRSAPGAVLDSLNENEGLSQSLGLNALSYRVCVFGVSGVFTGLAGSLYAHYTGFLSPEAFSFWTFVDMVVINVVGGVASPVGPVLGAVLLVPLPELLRDAKQFQLLSYALLLMAFVIFLPSGLIGGIRELRRRVGRP